jgi:hypothetical protein
VLLLLWLLLRVLCGALANAFVVLLLMLMRGVRGSWLTLQGHVAC